MPPRPPYLGHIHVDEKLDRWISRHASFASREWIRGQVCYGTWEKRGDEYQVTPRVTSGSEQLTIRITFTHHPDGGPEHPIDYAHIWGAHTIRSKKRRR